MMNVLRIVLGLGGLLLVYMGIGFMIDPVGSAADFGIAVSEPHGITSVRADMTAFFLVAGACLIWGAWTRQRELLLVGGALMLIPLAMRVVSLLTLGGFVGYIMPMAVEAVLGLAALAAARMLPARPAET